MIRNIVQQQTHCALLLLLFYALLLHIIAATLRAAVTAAADCCHRCPNTGVYCCLQGQAVLRTTNSGRYARSAHEQLCGSFVARAQLVGWCVCHCQSGWQHSRCRASVSCRQCCSWSVHAGVPSAKKWLLWLYKIAPFAPTSSGQLAALFEGSCLDVPVVRAC